MTVGIFDKFFASSYSNFYAQSRNSTRCLVPRISKLIPLLFIPFSSCLTSKEELFSREISLLTPAIDRDHVVCSTSFSEELKFIRQDLELSKKLAENLKSERDFALQQLKSSKLHSEELTYGFNCLLASSLIAAGLFFKVFYNMSKKIKELNNDFEQSRRGFLQSINTVLEEKRRYQRQRRFVLNAGIPPDYLMVGNERSCALCLSDFSFLSEQQPAALSLAAQPAVETANLTDDSDKITSHSNLRTHIKKYGEMQGEMCAIYCVTCIDEYFENGGNSCPSCSEPLQRFEYIKVKIIPPKVFQVRVDAHFDLELQG